MDFFWVNLGSTYAEVTGNNFLWAPLRSISANGQIRTIRHWSVVSEVKAGDVIFCAYDKLLTKVAIATDDAFIAPRPETRKPNPLKGKGNCVEIEFMANARPVLKANLAGDFVKLFNNQCDPELFNSNGTLNQIYMSRLSGAAGKYLLDAAGILVDFPECRVGESDILSETTREALRQERIGQARFRKALMGQWEGKCALTGLAMQELLVASHIVPWAVADDTARLDPYNGLLLAAHIDRLFESGLVSFADDGQLLISERLEGESRALLGLDKVLRISGLSKKHGQYLMHHREKFGYTF
ncbi:HNH endonuclease [Pseudomonas sp. CBC3]|uniref:HNH endonuclease n=1 Tax=Pseudomonas sp. CBC3 TaxID=3123318 RepID=UPI0030EA9BF3